MGPECDGTAYDVEWLNWKVQAGGEPERPQRQNLLTRLCVQLILSGSSCARLQANESWRCPILNRNYR